MRSAPRTLWIETFVELARLTALSGAVLVTVIALAAVIKPLSDGLLHAGDVLYFVALAIPPMLAYALPFAAGFASTLVYHRLGVDNEATACYAGGISHRAVLFPALVMGLALAGGLALLNEQVIPRFLREGQRLVTRDLPRLVSQEIDRGRAVMLPPRKDIIIYADRAERFEPDPASGALEQVLFIGFAVIRLDSDGNPVQELTAQRAVMWVYPASPDAQTGENESLVVIELEDVVAGDPSVVATIGPQQLAFRVPNMFRDNPKFLTFGELMALPSHPERMNWIDVRRRALAIEAARRQLIDRVRADLEKDGRTLLMDPAGHAVEIYARGLQREDELLRILPERGVEHVRVRSVRGGSHGPVEAETISPEAYLMPGVRAAGALASGITIELHRARRRDVITQPDFSAAPERATFRYPDLRRGDDTLEELLRATTQNLLTMCRPPALAAEQKDPLRTAYLDLEKHMTKLRRDVAAKQSERWAFATSCFVMTLTGAVIALRLSQRMPLIVYLLTFFPALGCFVTVSGGQQMAKQATAPGVLLMWSGVVALGVYAFVMYRRLARH